jgi:3-hydroxyisobutyrate dehydrogenase-like beta-hydroxyacid dehydrogenase
MPERIGFIGLGQMGQHMALSLLQAGFELRVFALREERIAPLLAQGEEPGASPGKVTEPGGIHLSLSTVPPEVSAQLAKVYRQQGSHFLAATVLGRPEVAEAARLSIFLSGHHNAKARVLPLLEALGSHIYDLGEGVEIANAVKLGYNFLVAAAIEAMGEAAALVEHCGADRAQFLRMLIESPLFTGAVYKGYGRMIGDRDYSDGDQGCGTGPPGGGACQCAPAVLGITFTLIILLS